MKLFDKRPLCLACAAAILLSFAFMYAGLIAVITAAVCAAAAAAVFAAVRTKAKRTVFVICAAVFLMCASFFIYHISVNSVSTGKVIHVSGYAVPGSENNYTKIYKITKADGKPVNIKALAYTDEYYCEDYTEFEGEALLSPYEGYSEYYYKSKGVLFSAEFSSFETTGKIHRSVSYYAGAIRDFAASCLYRVSDNAGILCRLFLGIRDGAPQSFISDMKTLGTSHLLAVSGLHVAALLAGLDLLLTKIAGKNRAKYVILSCVALLYMAVTGFTGSVVRASVMYLLSRLSLITGRKNDPVTSLMIAAFIIITVNPPSVYDVGFLLSFTAALGIIVAGAPLSGFVAEKLPAKLKFLKFITSPVIITLSFLLFTLPVAAFSYGELAYGAVLYNLLTAPFAVILLYLCPYLLLFSHIPFIGRGLGIFADGICSALVNLSHRLAQHSPPSVSVSYPFVIPLIIVFILAAVVLSFFSKKRLHYLCLALAFIVSFSAFASFFSLTESKKTAIIVSKGKFGDYAAVLDCGKCTVFDFTSGGADGFYPLTQKLLELGVTRADYVLAAEPESRHLQSAVRVFSYFDTEKVYAPSGIADTLSAFCGKPVIEADAVEQKYKNASLIKTGKALILTVGRAAYITGITDGSAVNFNRFSTVVFGSGTDKDSVILSEDAYYMSEYEKVLVIYVND